MTRVVLHIDKLVLRGVDRANAKALSTAISQALETELRAHANTSPLIVQGDRLHIQAGKVNASASAGATGYAIAKRLVSGRMS